MSRRPLTLFFQTSAILAAVPLLSLFLCKLVLFQLDQNWAMRVKEKIQREMPDTRLSRDEARSFTPTVMCKNKDLEQTAPSMAQVCTHIAGISQLNQVATAALIAIATALVSVYLAGILALSQPASLAVLFPLFFTLTKLSVPFLAFSLSALLIASLYYVGAVFLGSFHLFFLGALAFGAGLVAFEMIVVTFQSFGSAKARALGKKIDLEEHPKLRKFLNDLTKTTNSRLPDHVVVGFEPSIFVTDVDMTCVDGKLRGRTLFLSLPLCRLIRKDELSAVIGHELSHHLSEDQVVSKRFYPIYGGTLDGLDALDELLKTSRWKRVKLFALRFYLSYAVQCFAKAEKKLTRKRELGADAFGATNFGREAMASAIVKIHAFSGAWAFAQEEMKKSLLDGKQIVNASEFFSAVISMPETGFFLASLEEARAYHPTDLHPTLVERLGALHFSLKDIAAQSLSEQSRRKVEQSAISLIDNYQKWERALTGLEKVKNLQSLTPSVSDFGELISDAEAIDDERDRESA